VNEIDDSQAKREGLRAAARYLSSFLRRASPSAKAAEAWTSTERPDVIYLRNRDLGAWATATNARRPLFGDRSYWSNTNKYHPGRTHWDNRAIEMAADVAAERFGDQWVAAIARNSDFFEETR
jgi:hypothetical protein